MDVMFDKCLAEIAEALSYVPWIDTVYGRGERVAKEIGGRRVYLPAIWTADNEYHLLTPDSGEGNFAWIWVDDPQTVSRLGGTVTATISIIVWYDFQLVTGGDRQRDTLKAEVLNLLQSEGLRSGIFTATRIWELAENIYKDFSLEETENQFLMHPYGGFRIEGVLETSLPCIE